MQEELEQFERNQVWKLPDHALVDAIGDALRAHYGDEAADLPESLIALACRLDGPTSPDGETD